MYIIFDLLKKDNTPMNIASLKMDGCNYLGSMYQNNVVGRLFKRLKSVSNLPAGCPVLKVSKSLLYYIMLKVSTKITKIIKYTYY